jgi:hypothetical protein
VPAITAGDHVLKIRIDKPYFNLDWIEFTAAKEKTALPQFSQRTNSSQAYSVYDVLGNRVTSFQASESSMQNIWDKARVNLPGGIYVIKTNSKTIRISNTK